MFIKLCDWPASITKLLIYQICRGSESSGQRITSFTESLSRGLKNKSVKIIKANRYWNLAANTIGSVRQQMAKVLFAKYLVIYTIWGVFACV